MIELIDTRLIVIVWRCTNKRDCNGPKVCCNYKNVLTVGGKVLI